MYKLILILLLPLILPGSLPEMEGCKEKFALGNENFIEHVGTYEGRRIAVITNQTGLLADGTHIIDALVKNGANVVKIFSPEHGIRGDENYSGIDEKTGIPIVSLYGNKFKPSSSDLSDVDIIVYDIQDVGARFYTYTSTLFYAIEAAAENGKQIVICDRPVILNPDYTDGFMLEPGFESFVGKIPAPVCYGLTCGELGNFLAGEFLSTKKNVVVFEMKGYNRETDYDSLGLMWVKPSPNMFTSKTANCYPATCFLEGTNVSEGRGTGKPFEYFGAPWVDSDLLAEEMNSYGLEGVQFQPVSFTPSEKISDYPPKFFNIACNGIYIIVTDKKKFEPVKCGVALLISLHKLFREFKFDSNNYLDKLSGTDKLRKMVLNNSGYSSIVNLWKDDLAKFNEKRNNYLLYH